MRTMTKGEFDDLVAGWSAWWSRLQAQGEPGFEEGPRRIEDWLGSVDAYWRITTGMGDASVEFSSTTTNGRVN